VAFERFAGDHEVLTDAAAVALAQRDSATANDWLREAIALKPGAGRPRARLAGMLRARGDSAGAERVMAELAAIEAERHGEAGSSPRR
jgi:Flp pilus assembly protein TadD